ncbi:hypothetical protein P1X14_14235 [Sphingomonas sp. AOB5]|uniref:hypothetical protein n=1 Tax=Sphingomonas sp. AOB5 TaxID=3034017 RepID=UPI0023F875BB|nr:hypothetical protein [Sphingomonas sp. AOB5]MDF7776409.1 hypothetical protein [Sphingomonas sp. AOB5]
MPGPDGNGNAEHMDKAPVDPPNPSINDTTGPNGAPVNHDDGDDRQDTPPSGNDPSGVSPSSDYDTITKEDVAAFRDAALAEAKADSVVLNKLTAFAKGIKTIGDWTSSFIALYTAVQMFNSWFHFWKTDDTQTQILQELQKLEKKIDWLAVISELGGYQSNFAEIDALFQALNDNLDNLQAKLHDFDRAQSTTYLESEPISYLSWMTGVAIADPPVDIHKLVDRLVFESGSEQALGKGTSLHNLLTDQSGVGDSKTSYIAIIADAWRAAVGKPTAVADKDKALVRSSLYDLMQYLYFECLTIYRRANYLHDSAIMIGASLLYDEKGPKTQDQIEADLYTVKAAIRSRNADKSLKAAAEKDDDDRTIKATADAAVTMMGGAPSLAEFVRLHKFENNFADKISAIDWEKLFFGGQFADLQSAMDSQTSYAPAWNLLNTGTQAGVDGSQAYYYGDISCPDATAFVTGLALAAYGDTTSGYAIYLKAHFSKMTPGGICTAVGWYPQQPPTCLNQPGYVRVGAFEISKLQEAIDNAKGNEMLVIQSIGLVSTGRLHGWDSVGLEAQYGRLIVARDGRGARIDPFGPGLTSKLQSELLASNVLKISNGGDSNEQTSDPEVKLIDETVITRQMSDGSPDPAAIVTNAMIRRDEGASTLYLQAQVDAPLHRLPAFKAVGAIPFTNDPAAMFPGSKTPQTLEAGDLIDSGQQGPALDANGAPRTDGANELYFQMGDFGCALVLGDPGTGLDGKPLPWDKVRTGSLAYLQQLPITAPVTQEAVVFKVQSIDNVYIIQGGARCLIKSHADIPGGWPAVRVIPDLFIAHIAAIPLGPDYVRPG